MDYEHEQRGYEDEGREYRERSRSPRRERDEMSDARARSASPHSRERMDSRGPHADSRNAGGLAPPTDGDADDEAARNEGSNLFVTGIHPRLSEEEVTRLFEKYGEVETCNIMRDPHTKDSRGFGFVKMVTSEQADAAKEGLQGEQYEGRTLSIEKARRSKPRTPTPGKYFGPPKREFRGGRGGGGRFGGDRYEDRRGGYGRRDEYSSRGGSRYDRYDRSDRYDRYDRYDRGDDRSYGSSRRDRDDGPPRGGVDRYASGRDDRYSSSRDDRRGGYYDREGDRGGYEGRGGGTGGASGGQDGRDYGSSSRTYADRDDRYSDSRR